MLRKLLFRMGAVTSVFLMISTASIIVFQPAFTDSISTNNSLPAAPVLAFASSLDQNNVAIVNCSFFESHSSAEITQQLAIKFATNQPYLLIVDKGQDYRTQLLSDWNQASRANQRSSSWAPMNISLPRNLTTPNMLSLVSALAISYDPSGEVFGGQISNAGFPAFVSYSESLFASEVNKINQIKSSEKTNSSVAVPAETSCPKYFNGLAFVGYYTETMYCCVSPCCYGNSYHVVAGYSTSGWTIYEYTYTAPTGITYYDYAVCDQASVEGYIACGFKFRPSDMYVETNYLSSNDPSQTLYHHCPIDYGTIPQGKITESASANAPGVGLGISYCSPTGTICWHDQSNDQLGYQATNYNFHWNPFWPGPNVQTCTLYTTYPISTGWTTNVNGIIYLDFLFHASLSNENGYNTNSNTFSDCWKFTPTSSTNLY